MRNLLVSFSLVSLSLLAGCEGCDVTPIDALSPEIKVVNAVGTTKVCATEDFRDCAVDFGEVAINRGATLSAR